LMVQNICNSNSTVQCRNINEPFYV